ncbi:membrane-bound lytic murein transglycosylase A [Rhodoferax sp. OV413]|uniref:murein transglycosylase A n=1 Tax=Rhodoferax sp. OV413 TaxID=1855285 RepID=UPI00087EAA5E|nr:membrane-bound lytic murein transglycosylase A [Rhodoferax sp. OV413]
MVHQTISTSNTPAPSASSNSNTMNRSLPYVLVAVIVGILAGCATHVPEYPAPEASPTPTQPSPTDLPPYVVSGDTGPLPGPITQGKSRWTAVRWAELPGFGQDPLFEAWNAWIKSCERPGPVHAPLCKEVRRLSIGSGDEQRAWMVSRLQPYKVEPLQGSSDGLLTSYYEPMLDATRNPTSASAVPLYRPPANLGQRKPWYTRQEMETLPEAKAQLAGRAIAWLSDPVDALVLQIQGSGRLRITEADGSQRLVRLAYAGTNDQPYKSVGRWLLDQGLIRDATWPGIKAWIVQNPQRVNELLWSNPRTVFFREEVLSELDAAFGPRGAQGVPLTPGRSIAVDPTSIPYGTPVWLASPGPLAQLQKLVFAQDTGSAITGAVRADYFAGWGPEAGEFAGRVKQPLKLWVLWPK